MGSVNGGDVARFYIFANYDLFILSLRGQTFVCKFLTREKLIQTVAINY